MSSSDPSTDPAFENPDTALDRGIRQWQKVWRRFASQWSQPELMKLAESIFPGGRHLHSSQISRFSSGNFRDPSPKLLLVIGQLNQALADGRLPESLRPLWEGRQPMGDSEGRVLGATEIFLAITGQLELGAGRDREIPFHTEESVCRSLRRFLREHPPAETISSEILNGLSVEQAKAAQSCLQDLINRRVVPGFRIVDNLPAMAVLCKVDEDALWDICGEAIAATALSSDGRVGLRGRPRKLLRHPRHNLPFGRSIAQGSPQLTLRQSSRSSQLGPRF